MCYRRDYILVIGDPNRPTDHVSTVLLGYGFGQFRRMTFTIDEQLLACRIYIASDWWWSLAIDRAPPFQQNKKVEQSLFIELIYIVLHSLFLPRQHADVTPQAARQSPFAIYSQSTRSTIVRHQRSFHGQWMSIETDWMTLIATPWYLRWSKKSPHSSFVSHASIHPSRSCAFKHFPKNGLQERLPTSCSKTVRSKECSAPRSDGRKATRDSFFDLAFGGDLFSPMHISKK